jgi:hypothetical protein
MQSISTGPRVPGIYNHHFDENAIVLLDIWEALQAWIEDNFDPLPERRFLGTKICKVVTNVHWDSYTINDLMGGLELWGA